MVYQISGFLECVVSNTQSQYCDNVSLVLGYSLLWKLFDPEESEKVPVLITNQVREAYSELANNGLEADMNHVQKVALLVTRDDAGVFIDLLLEDEGVNNQSSGALVGGVQQITLDRRANWMGTQELNHMNSILRETRLLKLQNKNLRKLMSRPALMHDVHV